MPARPLVDPRMLGQLNSFYPSTATIRVPSNTTGTTGQPLRAYADSTDPTLAGIPCRVTALTISRFVPEVTQKGEGIITDFTHIIFLQGYYPQIQTNWRVSADGSEYDIVGNQSDGNHIQTELRVELVKM